MAPSERPSVAPRGPRWLGVAATLLWALAPAAGRADPPPPTEGAGELSPYERETLSGVLRSLGVRRAVHPEGKTIDRVEVVPLDVFEGPAPRSPWAPVLRGAAGRPLVGLDLDIAVPDLVWANVFHATTQKAVIRRELLLRPGEPYRQILVDDSIRNLRRLPELSLVLIEAIEGKRPDRVGIVIITKDVWSLRASWDIVATPGGIQELALAPTETNLFGTQQTVRGEYIFEPSAHTLGLEYTIPRIDSSRIAVDASADMMINRASGRPEGSYGGIVAGEPLVSGLTPWAWDATVEWRDLIDRSYQNAQLQVFVDPHGQVPFEYLHREFDASYEVTRSLGWAIKHDFTLSAGLDRNVYRVNLPGYNPQAVADFVTTEVPESDTRVGPGITYHSYAKRYLRVIDFETLGLQEDMGLGHDVVLHASPSFRALGSSRDVLDLYGALQYTVPLGDGLARAFFVGEVQPEVDHVSDSLINPGVRIVSPSIAGLARVVVDGALVYRPQNYLNVREALGGGTRLRGYPTNFFRGWDEVVYNLEVRSRPVELLSCQLGAVAFYDVGDAFTGWSHFVPYQSVGFGMRALFPQLDRIVFRVDVGFPIEHPVDPSTGSPVPPAAFLVSFGQAFGMPTVDPTPVLPTGATETPPATSN